MLPPVIGLFAWSCLLVLLLRYDGAQGATTSRSLWLPAIWMFIIGSRLPSQWLGMTETTTATAFEEGSGIDRTIFLILIALAMAVLAKRHISWSAMFERNIALALFLCFALAS